MRAMPDQNTAVVYEHVGDQPTRIRRSRSTLLALRSQTSMHWMLHAEVNIQWYALEQEGGTAAIMTHRNEQLHGSG